jgi:hypothetical protein
MIGEGSTNGEKSTQNFGKKELKERNNLEDASVHGRILK